LIGTSPDIGTPESRAVVLLVVGVLYFVMALSQSLTPYLTEKPDPLTRRPAGGAAAKVFLLVGEAFERVGIPVGGTFGQAAATQFANDRLYRTDQLQTVLVLGESESPEAALDWLTAIRSGQELKPLAKLFGTAVDWRTKIQPHDIGDSWAQVKTEDGLQIDTEVLADAEAMHALYTLGRDALRPEQQDRLRDRYGWLGELTLTPPDSPERDALFADIPWAITLIVLALVICVIGGLGGLTMLIVAAVYFFTGRLKRRFVPPPRGGSVFLETFGVFLAGYGLLHFGAVLVTSLATGAPGSNQNSPPADPAVADDLMRWIMLGTLLVQWLLMLAIFWPRLRGVSWPCWRDAVGWRAPHGVLREILAGVAGYFAGLPVFVGAVVCVAGVSSLIQGSSEDPIEPPHNPMIDRVANGDVLMLALFLALATVWAPIVEETVFRGSIYRHMRARHGAFLCALATGSLFAFLHPYGPLMDVPLIALGFTFAMIREWRGSLIGAVTAHCLHNSTIMVLMLVGLQAAT
jgi:membrane protease YdiL (CAAX protease family)